MAAGRKTGGRQKGTPNKRGAIATRTREVAEKAAAEGVTPLDVMLSNMRHFQKLAESAEKALAELSAAAIAELQPDDQFKRLMAEVKKTVGLRESAQGCARDAAPYMHSRLASVEHSGKEDGPPIRFIMENAPDAA